MNNLDQINEDLEKAMGLNAQADLLLRMSEKLGSDLDEFLEADPATKAYQHLYSQAMLMDERNGARLISATDKAFTELRENKSIEFKNGVLTFVSRESGKKRIVTKFGCSSECECKGNMSYHLALFSLCEMIFGTSFPIKFDASEDEAVYRIAA